MQELGQLVFDQMLCDIKELSYSYKIVREVIQHFSGIGVLGFEGEKGMEGGFLLLVFI